PVHAGFQHRMLASYFIFKPVRKTSTKEDPRKDQAHTPQVDGCIVNCRCPNRLHNQTACRVISITLSKTLEGFGIRLRNRSFSMFCISW
ncbi:hypothetical protein PISMIDRAFT_681570, partial [Pisolithus microcarpus 441]